MLRRLSIERREEFVARLGLVSCLLVVMGTSGAASAWSPLGHQTVGAVADRLIAGTNAGTEVQRILGSSLESVSVWADCAKGVKQDDAGFRYRDPGKYPECAPFETKKEKAQLVAFVLRNATSCKSGADDEACRHKAYHYTDVAIQRDHYSREFVGTSDHDLIAAIGAAIAVLQGKPSPPPFRLESQREALRVLVHYMGDLHQPLHVASVYLDAAGRVVDPDAGRFDPKTSTRGGNSILDGKLNLHAVWDRAPGSARAAGLDKKGIAAARAERVPSGSIAEWPARWATDTLRAGRAAFDGLAYAPRSAGGTWRATVPRSYRTDRIELQRRQLTKAGARLALILRAIWP